MQINFIFLTVTYAVDVHLNIGKHFIIIHAKMRDSISLWLKSYSNKTLTKYDLVLNLLMKSDCTFTSAAVCSVDS